ncbi:MmgE/PrpD family protein [Parahaliea maris]|uniref:MmgE/PrpD family protein n=1 Tax=Parahaliea maris TaxID=2716870 RepID=A0A5C8ZRQ9_9GAMM|nr:MmgE/PrpD family protein [Parahaliea maris]TXS90262.1 MmgE/PrpD family protein [Parahaliea maris]
MQNNTPPPIDSPLATRRGVLLAGASLALAIPTAKALPDATGALSMAAAGEPRATGESRRVAEFIALCTFEQLPDAAVRMARYSILDALGVSMAAAGLEPACAPFIRFAQDDGAAGTAVILGTGLRAHPLTVALVNGSLAHALDYEDTHGASFTHPNAAAVAAAFSLASARGGVTGKRFITAVALGCDITCRLSLAQGNVGAPPDQYYPPAIVGTFGATVAASYLLGLDARQVLDALSLALCANSASAAIVFNPHSDIRAIRDGQCAQVGLQSALLAQQGVRGFDAPFEGKGGFFDMYSRGHYLPGVMVDGLGSRFAGEDVGYKAWPACRATHIYIQAILEGMQRDPVAISEIEKVTVFIRELDLIVSEPAAGKRRPRAAIDAKFSIYFVVATALLTREVTLKSFTAEALVRKDLLNLADKVKYQRNDSQARPGSEGGGTLLTITLRDGSQRHWGIDTLYGSPANPLSEEVLKQKFVDCGLMAQRDISADTLQAIAEQVLSLDAIDDMRTLSQSL